MVVELIQRLVRLPNLCSQVQSKIVFDITKNGKSASVYTLDFVANAKSGVFTRGYPKTNDQKLTLIMDDDDFARLVNHRFKIGEGISSGKIKAKGDLAIIPRLNVLFDTPTSRTTRSKL